MILRTPLFISKIEDNKIIGEDLTDGTLYTCKFFTDIDIKTLKNNSRESLMYLKKEETNFKNRKFNSQEVTKEQLIQMLQNSSNFEGRTKKVKEKTEAKIKKDLFLNDLNKVITNLKEEEKYIKNNEEEYKIRSELILKYLNVNANVYIVNKENFNETFGKLQNKYTEKQTEIEKAVNLSYDFTVNCPILFTGFLENNTINSKNCYVDTFGNITKRKSFYSVGLKGDFFKDDFFITLRINKKEQEDGRKTYDYVFDSKMYTKEKVLNVIKRDLNTLKANKDLFLFFQRRKKEEKIELIEKYQEILKKYLNEKRELQEKIKNKKNSTNVECFSKYKKEFIEIQEDIFSAMKEDSFYEDFKNKYNIKLPINNHYEFHLERDKYIKDEIRVLKNINNRLLTTVCELRSKDTGNDIQTTYNNIESWIFKTMVEEVEKRVDSFICYFRICGFNDEDNSNIGFMTLINNNTNDVKNFFGFAPNLKMFDEIKNEIVLKLKKIKDTLEK